VLTVSAGAFQANDSTGTRVAIAILLHKLPDGFVALSVTTGQRDWRRKVGLVIEAVLWVGACLRYLFCSANP